jgi:hypothetical protein
MARTERTWCPSRCKICISQINHPGKKTTSELFWLKVDKSAGPDACWPWLGTRHYRGYGKFGNRRSAHENFAHRYAYADTHGEIGQGIEIRHNCDNPPCCNPAHLLPGTHLENMRDMVERKRLPDRRGELGYTTRLTVDQVVEIRQRAANGELYASIDFKIARVTVSAIKRRRLWKHVA